MEGDIVLQGVASVVCKPRTARYWVFAIAIACGTAWSVGQSPRNGTAPADIVQLADPAFRQRLLDPTTLIARVGDLPILSGDLLPMANQMLESYRDKLPASEFDTQRVLALRQLLPRKIDEKLAYLDFLRTVPADKQHEVLQNVSKQVDKQFYEMVVERLQERLKAKSLAELDAKLRGYGSSIDRQKATFKEQQIAQFMMQRQAEEVPEVTRDELYQYYQENMPDYAHAAKVRWEKLTALLEKYPSKVAAEQAIVEMGNQVLMGKPFAAVAKSLSQGTNAIDGGQHDWTSQGSLVSEVLDHAIFNLPVGQLSQILEDQRGFHIVRVIERKPAGRPAFVDAQDEIRTKLTGAKRAQLMKDYIARLRRDTYVWTLIETPKSAPE